MPETVEARGRDGEVRTWGEMNNQIFEQPILNSPYDYALRHWKRTTSDQPVQLVHDIGGRAEFTAPISKLRKQTG